MDKKTFHNLLRRVIAGQNITRTESRNGLIALLDHEFEGANDVCFGAYFAALQTKHPTIDETAGLMDAVMNYDRIPVAVKRPSTAPFCGIIGSGKDEIKTFNISSIAAIIAAAAGATVVKNGSRAEASVAGATDVFGALGVNVMNRDVRLLERSLVEIRFCFSSAEACFPRMAREYIGKFFFVHPLSYILPVASGLQFDRVVFGLANDRTEFTAQLLVALGYDRSLVVAGHDDAGRCFDEISTIGPTTVTEIRSGKWQTTQVQPEDFGIVRAQPEDIDEGSSIRENADIFFGILEGRIRGPKRDIVAVNAGAILYIADLVPSMRRGTVRAIEVLDSGLPLRTLHRFIELFHV